MKRLSYTLVISALAISAVFFSSTSSTALSIDDIDTYDGNIFQLSHDELIKMYPDLDGLVVPDTWPNQKEPDIEAENGDTLPDFEDLGYLIVKQANKSYIFIGEEVPTTWDEFASVGTGGISSYSTPVPEPSTIILLGFSLLFLIATKKGLKKA